MRSIATILLVGALGIWGCGDGAGEGGGASGEGGGNGERAAQARSGDAQQRAGEGAGGRAPAGGDEAFDPATPAGTIGLFITHMQRGEFDEALLLTDPESVGYAELAEGVTVLANAAEQGEGEGMPLEALMRAFFSRGWQGAVWQPVSVQDERARFEVKLVDYDPRTIDLRRTDEQWLVLAPAWVMRVKGDVSDLVPQQPGAGDGGDDAEEQGGGAG